MASACNCYTFPCACLQRRYESQTFQPLVVTIPRLFFGDPPGTVGFGGVTYVEVDEPRDESLRSEDV